MGPRRRVDTKNSAKAQQQALQTLAQARALHRETQELEAQFTQTLRNFTSSRQYFDEGLHQLRQTIVQNYTKIVFIAYEYAIEKEIEVHLWRAGFYMIIEACRAGLRKRQSRSTKATSQGGVNVNIADADTNIQDDVIRSQPVDKLKIFLDSFLYEATGFYLCLLRRMFSELGMKCPEYLNLCGIAAPMSFTEGPTSFGLSLTTSGTRSDARSNYDNNRGQSEKENSRDSRDSGSYKNTRYSDREGNSRSRETEGGTSVNTHHPAVNESVHRSLIFLGDLARYHDGLSDARGPIFSSAHSFYFQAFYGSPEDGRVFNQLAILSQSRQRYPLESVYYYFRALCATVPFGNAGANLSSFLVRVKQPGNPPTQFDPENTNTYYGTESGIGQTNTNATDTGAPAPGLGNTGARGGDGDENLGLQGGLLSAEGLDMLSGNMSPGEEQSKLAAQMRFYENNVLMTAFVTWHRSLRGLTNDLEETQAVVERVLTPRAFCLLANSDSFKDGRGGSAVQDVEDHVVTRIMLISISAAHTKNTPAAVQSCIWTARQIMEATLLVDTHSPDAEDLLIAVIIFFEWLLTLLSAPGRNVLTIETMSRLQQSDWSVIARLTNYHVGNDANMRALGEVFFSAWKNALQTHHTTKNSLGRRDKSRLPALPEDIALQGFSPLGSLFETVRLPASETTCTTTVPGGDLRTHRASRLYGFALLASSLPNTVIPIEAVSASTRQADALQAGGRVADSSESDTVSDDGNHGNGSRTGSVNLSRRSSASCKSLQQAKVSYGAFLLENGGGNGTGSTTNNGNSTGGGGNAYPEMTHSHSASNISNTTASTESGAIKVFKASREINGYRKVWHQGAGGGEWRREGDYEFLRAKESKRETLMKAMGKQRLLAVVDSLEQKVGHAESNSRIEGEPQSGQPSQGNIGMDTGTGVGSTGRGRGGNNGNGGVLMSGSGVNDGVSGLEYQYTLYVVPDLHVVLYSRNHLNAVIGQKRFIVVIASAVVAALDMLKTSDRQGDYRNNRGGRFGIGMDDQGGGGGGSGNGPNYATSVQPSHKEIMAASRWIENMQQTNGQHFQVQPQANARLSSNAMGNMGGNSGGSNNVGGYNADTQDTVEERCWRGVVACARDLLKSRADKVEHTQASGSESMYAILLLNRGLSYDPTTALGVHVSRSDAFVTSVAPEINLNDVRKPRHRRK